MSTKNDWAEYDAIFGEAKKESGNNAPQGDFDEPPAGIYVVRIERAEWKEAKSTGAKFLSFGLVILKGDFKKRWIWKSSFLSSVQSAKFLIKDLAAIGIKLEKISLLDLEILLDICLEVKITVKAGKDGKEFRNVDFLREIDLEQSENSSEEDTPF